MKKRIISLLLTLVIMLGIIPQFAFDASAATQLPYAPYANVEYKETSSVKCGTIRYVAQMPEHKDYFFDSYWGSYKNVAREQCPISSMSMALSYIGIDKTPKDLLDAGNGKTYLGRNWGGSEYVGVRYDKLSAAMDRYINGNGKYSPLVIHLNEYSDLGHWVVLVGRVDEDTYQVLDPANQTLWKITINGKKASYTLPSGKKVTNDTIDIGVSDDIKQWYNKNAAGIKAEIITQPKSGTAFEGKTAKVTVKASGQGLTYKWYYKSKGSSKFSLTNSFTGNTYSVKMNEDRDGRQLYCVVTDKYGNAVTSNTVTISMVKITAQPKSVAVDEGAKAKTSVKVTGSGVTYQWYYKDPGSTSFSKSSLTGSTYSVTLKAAKDGRQVYCKITDTYGNSVNSETATLSIKKTAKITTQPKSVAVEVGQTATTSFKATGDGLTYQWYFKNPGKSSFSKSSLTGTTYYLEMKEKYDGRQVYCKVTDKYGNSVKTDTVTLSIKKTAKITTQPKSVAVLEGQKAKTSIKATGDGLTYQWYYKDPGKSSFTKSTLTGTTYSVTMDAKKDGRQIYCKVTDQYGNSVKTNTVTLSISKVVKTKYAAYCTIKASAKTSAMTLPCSSSTDKSSAVAESVAKGKTYTATGLILNTQGNYWYQVTTSDGKTAYVPSSKMTFVDDLTKDIKITGEKNLSTLKKGKTFSIEGKITSTYNTITKVVVKIYEGEKASGTVVDTGSATVNGKSYNLKGSEVDSELLFNKLAAGKYTYAVYVYYSNYYAKTETTNGKNTGNICVYKDTFTVK